MTISFEVPGKCLVQTNGTLTLGMSDADEMVTFREIVNPMVFHSNESGPHLPAKIIEGGRYGILRMPLTQVDHAVLDPLQTAAGATTIGQQGSIGTDIVLTNINIKSSIAGAKSYSFLKCYLSEPVEIAGWGNTVKKWVIEATCIPDPTLLSNASNQFYTVTTN